MYKFLLSWRYLRTRYIALASIISVTLGVATLVVVNSVMAGFSAEMHKRLHGILAKLGIGSASGDALRCTEATKSTSRSSEAGQRGQPASDPAPIPGRPLVGQKPDIFFETAAPSRS